MSFRTLYLTGFLAAALALQARAQQPQAPRESPDAGTPDRLATPVPQDARVDDSVACDALHPSHFTTIRERRPDEEVKTPLFKPEDAYKEPVGARPLTPRCQELPDSFKNAGRWSISERSELILTFDPSLVSAHTGHLGRLDVEGQLLSGGNARPLIVPGYREIGKPVPTFGAQASQVEGTVSDLMALLHATVQVGSEQTLQLQPTPSGDGYRLTDWTGKWVVTRLFQSPTDYSEVFQNILDHSAAFSGQVETREEKVKKRDGVLAQSLLVARLGQFALQRRQELVDKLTETVAADENRLDRKAWRTGVDQALSRYGWLQDQAWYREARSPGAKDLTRFRCRVFDTTALPICAQSSMQTSCQALDEAQLLICNPPATDQVAKDYQKHLEQAIDNLKKQDAAMQDRFDAQSLQRRQYLKSLDPAGVYRDLERYVSGYLDTDVRPLEPTDFAPLLQDVMDALGGNAYLDSFLASLRALRTNEILLQEITERDKEQLEQVKVALEGVRSKVDAAEETLRRMTERRGLSPTTSPEQLKALEEARDVAEQALQGQNQLREKYKQLIEKATEEGWRKVGDRLRERLTQLVASGWREIRLQPKVIGARAGDVIELTISYLPSGSTPPEQESAPAAPTSGETRPARWTVRFLVDQVGFYVLAGPRLSLVSTFQYAPNAQTFRGAQGSLVPGIGVDFQYFAGRDAPPLCKLFNFLFTGGGLRVDYVDFDSAQAVEIGLELHLLTAQGILSLGAGYDTSIPSPRWSPRNFYGSVGLGVDKLLDQAIKLADQSAR